MSEFRVAPTPESTSLFNAIAAARQAGRGGRIRIEPGLHFLPRPIVLGPADAGLTLAAAEPGLPTVLIGGQAVTDWQREDDRLWSAPVAGVASGDWDFRALVVDGRLADRARLPEVGFFQHETDFTGRWMSTTAGGWDRKPTEPELTALRYAPGDLGEWLEPRNAEITVYHMWDESMVGVASHDPKERLIRFSNPAGHPPGAFNVHKYEVWNVREGLTRPGQWYLDRPARRVVYWPLPGQDMAAATVWAPTMDSLVVIASEAADSPRGSNLAEWFTAAGCGQGGGEIAQDIALADLTLCVSNTPLQAGGFAASRQPAAVDVRDAKGLRFEGVEITAAAGHGMRMRQAEGVCVRRCHLHGLGAGGIDLNAKRFALEDNHVHHTGRLHPSAIAIRAAGPEGAIRHNEVHDTTYTGINSSRGANLIEGNRIYRCMQALHDGAGIFVTFCQGLVLRGNFIHDVVAEESSGASAYYLDEQSDDCLVEGNLSLRVCRANHNHMNHRNTYRGNVFATDGDMTITLLKCQDDRYEGNVFCAGGQLALANEDGLAGMRNNVLHSARAEYQSGEYGGYEVKRRWPWDVPDGNDTRDPRMTVSETGRVQFAVGSPARELGIAELDVRNAGVRD